MGSTLAQLRDRVETLLSDAGNAIYTTTLLDECLRSALAEYSHSLPRTLETAIELPGDGREIDLSGLDGFLEAVEVWWPYDSDAAEETWPPNRVRGWTVYWDDANPVLFLNRIDGSEPQAGDELRLWYTAKHTIQNLDGASVTTLRPDHESLLAQGAAAYAALARAHDLIEEAGTDLYQVGLLGSWGLRMLKGFQSRLAELRGEQARKGAAFGAGWKLDQWDKEGEA